MKVAGVLSGTSVDGVDVAIVEFDGGLQVLGHRTIDYPAGVREAILAVSNARAHTGEIARLHFLLGELFAEAVIETCGTIGLPAAGLDLIGSHGQTIFHQGEPTEFHGHPIAATLQIGEPAVIAKRTGVLTIADFRADDIAAGGKGAPLVPLLDFRMFRHPVECRIALNIGGISNLTAIPANAALEDVAAFDIGPGNMVLDALMGRMGQVKYDRDGATARAGRVDPALLETLLSDPYYRQPPPKTAGREQYGEEFVARFGHLSLPDAAATATELTVQAIARAVAHYPEAAQVIASGGGVHNGYMMERLRATLRPAVRLSPDFGVDTDAKEAIAFALLAYESYHSRPGNVPRATGAHKAVVLGKRSYP